MRINDPRPVRRRKAINVSLDPKLVEARALGVNLSRACELGFQNETKAARDAKLRDELAPTIAYWNAYVEEHGLPLAKYRQF